MNIEHPKLSGVHTASDQTPTIDMLNTATDNELVAAASNRRAIYRWHAQTTADGAQTVELKLGSTVKDFCVCALASHGVREGNCWYVVEPNTAVNIALSTTVATLVGVWMVDL